ncbi:MAG: sugar ABC transporter substrate-binding protein [Spirochaetaceae bacterium]|jgi:inositol transport system substrate-binding protein|nr:sugar ABC transporter substrate-binding protein [Spirochaetaceae bacterium]
MKKIAIGVMVFSMTVSSMVFASGAGQQGDSKRVVYITRAQADLFAAWLANSIKEEAKNYPGIKVDIVDGQADDAKQNAAIENAITNKYDVIILQPNDSEAQIPYVKKAVEAKIPVILTNPRIPDPAIMSIANSVDADPYEQGAVVARFALTQIPQNAKVVVLRGPDGNLHSIERRRAWQQEFFAKRPDVQIVGEQSGHWNKDEGMRYMEDWVQANPQIDAVCSMNDNMAMGAIEAVKGNPKFAKLLVYGVDGDAAAALLIKEGVMTATAFQNADELAKQNMKLAAGILSGQVTAIVNEDIICPLYTKDNIDELIAVHKKTGAIK